MLVDLEESERKKIQWVKKHLKTKKNSIGDTTDGKENNDVDINAYGKILFQGIHEETRSKVGL